jgi:hypothetical protein
MEVKTIAHEPKDETGRQKEAHTAYAQAHYGPDRKTRLIPIPLETPLPGKIFKWGAGSDRLGRQRLNHALRSFRHNDPATLAAADGLTQMLLGQFEACATIRTQHGDGHDSGLLPSADIAFLYICGCKIGFQAFIAL